MMSQAEISAKMFDETSCNYKKNVEIKEKLKLDRSARKAHAAN